MWSQLSYTLQRKLRIKSRYLSSVAHRETFTKRDVQQLLKELKLGRKSRLLAVEGHRSVVDVLKWGLIPYQCLIGKKALAAPLGCSLSNLLRPHLGCVYDVDDTLLHRISKSETNQGVVLIVEKAKIGGLIQMVDNSIDDDQRTQLSSMRRIVL